ncbi:hypothetical protein [Rickettsiella massiliensis]|nr:hypothetical protein [Rickettsiella massiliensis]
MQGLVSTVKQVGLKQTQFEKTLATLQAQQQNDKRNYLNVKNNW